ncbi:protein phosphatase 1 regulatory subunit 14A isoform X1 [Saimiri boliviensis]|uniref:protein phosphatase 1 regulatory subunit 14A isoform X1 n=1 Tax=Saimiri boliviensis TaxID=27679 RepID=UPI003D786927
MAAQRLGKRVLSKLQSPSRARGPGGSPGGLQKRHARVTVKYDRRELQRRLDVEKWIDGRLEELYRGMEADMPDEVNIDELLELESEEERRRKIQGLLKSCRNPIEISGLAHAGAQQRHDSSLQPRNPELKRSFYQPNILCTWDYRCPPPCPA